MFEPFLAQGRQFRHVEREQLPWDMKLYWLLREEERSLLTKLTTAYTNIQITLHPPQPSDNFQLDQPLSLHSIMFILESTLRKCVHFAKTVPDFMELPEADQIAILKASALETYAIRSAALFVVERNAWHSYFGDMHMKDIMAVFGDPTSVEVFANYCAAMKSVVKANSTIYALVHCIILFDVRNARLEDFGKVSAIQDKYLVLLKHYLQSEFSYLHGSRYLAELMALLEDMHKLHHRILFFYKQFSSFFRPLISEFFAG
ncbi:vitamin D3 receptor-like [Babylonia areolata]|uniref:vitamin D3 receptor-like n=1 Tax=Babylonia areolata TaxID=304850 RepID=UPI003FD3C88A